MSKPEAHTRWRAVLASALVPAAVLFAIPGLTESWYVQSGTASDPTRQNITKADPPLLIAGQSVALFFNVVASVSLIFRIMGHSVFRLTLTCITSLILALVLDILCLAIFGATHSYGHKDGYVLSTAYWLTLVSALFSLTSVVALTVDVLKARIHRQNVHVLTPKQRSLALLSFHFMAYLAIGSLIYKYVISLTFIDAIYFVLQSTLTVGYGDITPYNTAAKIISFFYFPFGIVLVGIMISLIRETAVAGVEARIRRRLQHSPQIQDAAQQFKDTMMNSESHELGVEKVRGETYDQYLRRLVEGSKQDSYLGEIIASFTLFLCFWLIGSVIFQQLENWSFFIALYFTFMTFTVIGYGEFYPKTPGGRAFYIGWGVLGIVIMTILFSVLAEAWQETYAVTMRRRVLRQLTRSHRQSTTSAVSNTHEDSQKKGKLPFIRSKSSNPMQAESSTRPNPISHTEHNASSMSEGEQLDNVEKDAQHLERDVNDEAPRNAVNDDVIHLLNDLEGYLKALSEKDNDGMRDALERVIKERDNSGKGNEAVKESEHQGGGLARVERLRTLEDDDKLLSRMLLKHCQLEIAGMRERMQQQRS